MRNIEYRMFGATMRLVVFVFVVATGLLLFKAIDAPQWLNITISLVGGWVLRDGVTKAAEAFRDTRPIQ
jgi:hypothetical protein